LIRRAHQARLADSPALTVWGTGTPRREFICARDLADACVFVMLHYDSSTPINLGGGQSLSIAETAQAICDVVGYRGRLVFDTSKPDGMPLKMLDSGPLRRLGWQPATDFSTALAETYDWFLHHEVTETAAP
jgi:GDP-L-fucose synthase